MIYALVLICATQADMCVIAEDSYGPYETVEDFRARHVENRDQIRNVILPLYTQAWRQSVRVLEVCDTLERIRQHLPDAFDGAEPEVKL